MYSFKASDVPTDNDQKCSYKNNYVCGVRSRWSNNVIKKLKTLVKILCRGSRCIWNAESYYKFWPPLICTVECIFKLDF
jgi:hypothetical protein